MSALPQPQFDAWTVDDLPDVTWPRYEIIDGSLLVTPMPNVDHQMVVQLLSDALNAARPSGVIAVSGVGIQRPTPIGAPQRFLVPDVSVVTLSRGRGLALTPDAVHLAVEVLSDSTGLMDRTVKAELYAQMGIPCYWVLDLGGQLQRHALSSRFGDAPAWMQQAHEAFLVGWRELDGS